MFNGCKTGCISKPLVIEEVAVDATDRHTLRHISAPSGRWRCRLSTVCGRHISAMFRTSSLKEQEKAVEIYLEVNLHLWPKRGSLIVDLLRRQKDV